MAGDDFIKKEIDIVVYDSDQKEKHAIELKFPRNVQYPVQMYSFCQDIRFLEQLCCAGFDTCQFTVVADDSLFYQGNATKPIYQFFRRRKPISVLIEKPTGDRHEHIVISHEYFVAWRTVIGPMKYALIEIGN